MKILLCGYGRMGHCIEQAALAAGDQIAAIMDIQNAGEWDSLGPVADVAIDFSHPSALPSLANYVRRTGTPLVSGATGYTDADRTLFQSLGQYAPVMHSANYSLGIAVLCQALSQVASVLEPDFDIEIVETHHNQKVDAPSGTAKLLWQAVDPQQQLKPVYGREGFCGKRDKQEIGIHALRGGTEAGTHTVTFFGPDETLEFTHRAASRQIFANGALHMARLLRRKEKGVYTLPEVLFGGNKP